MSPSEIRTVLSFLLCFHALQFSVALSTNQVRELSNKQAAEVIQKRIPGNCKTNEYDCGEKCISIDKWRDCNYDCNDRSDEECWPGFVKCPGTCTCVDQADEATLCIQKVNPSSKLCSISGTYRCANGNCILPNWVNDLNNDCGDWSDEKNYTTTTTTTKKV